MCDCEWCYDSNFVRTRYYVATKGHGCVMKNATYEFVINGYPTVSLGVHRISGVKDPIIRRFFDEHGVTQVRVDGKTIIFTKLPGFRLLSLKSRYDVDCMRLESIRMLKIR